MSLFLFKPHVTGPNDQVTSPDVVIDSLQVDGRPRSVNVLTGETYLQSESDETGRAGYVLTALGGGALIGPALVLSSGRVCIARQAWRLKNLADFGADLTLNGTRLSDLVPPAQMIAAAGGEEDALPRGLQLVCTIDGDTETAVLEDAQRGRRLRHRLVIAPLDHDRWQGARPRPRYSVGPMMKEVDHYI